MERSSFDFLQALIELEGLNLNTWNFFVSIHLALGGLVFVVRRMIYLVEKLVMLSAYWLFIAMNCSAQFVNYQLYERMLTAWSKIYEPSFAAQGAPIQPELTLGVMHPTIYIITSFSLAGAITTLFIFNINRLSHTISRTELIEAERAPRKRLISERRRREPFA